MAFQLALAAILSALALREVISLKRSVDANDAQRARLIARESFEPSQASLALPLEGLDLKGKLLATPASLRGSATIVVCVLHTASLERELQLWEEISRETPGTTALGYCESLECARELPTVSRDGFDVIAYAEYHTARVLARADGAGRALIVDGSERIIGSVAWTDASPPSTIAAAIVGVR
ncbi:MAG TPA: hypothetical protein VN690_00695 [Terriglobales bacterium]|nr:hypothetical protein [Terriglobales bacterium]